MKICPTNQTSASGRFARFVGVPLCVGLAVVFMMSSVAFSQSPATVDLGNASGFAVLAAAGITNEDATALIGDIGSYPTDAIVGFPPGTYTGTNYGNSEITHSAMIDLNTAYKDAAGRSGAAVLSESTFELGGTTQIPGVYKIGSSAAITGTLTLNGSGVYIFQIGSTLTTEVSSVVSLSNGARWSDVFWQVGSSATLGVSSVFEGTLLANTSITANSGATVHGRLLAGAVTSTGAVVLNGLKDSGLPVTLSEFNIMLNGNAVHLSWITSSEVDHLGFNIERKESGDDWVEIASYQEHENLAGHGNTSAEHQYSYTDSEVLRGKTYSYRLLDVDVSGKVETRDDMVRTITVPESMGPEFYELVGAYPNPFNPVTTIAFNVHEIVPVQLTIHNILGQIIRHLQNREFQPGYYEISWDATDDRGQFVPGGVYFVQVSSEKFTTKVQKILLLK